jgi:hypothetical protein
LSARNKLVLNDDITDKDLANYDLADYDFNLPHTTAKEIVSKKNSPK